MYGSIIESIKIDGIGISDKAMAFRVVYPSNLCANKIPHITICTSNGGKKEMKVIRIYSCGECPYCRSKTIRNSRRHTTRYCTLIKQYIKGQSIPVECTLKEQ